MGVAYAYLVLGTYHAEGFHTAYFGFLYLEFLSLRSVERGAYCGDHYCLTCCDIGRAAHYLCGFAVAEVNGCDV